MCVFFQVGAIYKFCSSLASTNQYMTWGCHTIYRSVLYTLYILRGSQSPGSQRVKKPFKFKEGNQKLTFSVHWFFSVLGIAQCIAVFTGLFFQFFVLHPAAAKLAGRRMNFVQGIHRWTKWQAAPRGIKQPKTSTL